MHYIIGYDIANPKRLRRVARVCEDYGLRIQKSIFNCELTSQMHRDMMDQLTLTIDTNADSIISVPSCAACIAGRTELGLPLIQAIPDVLIA
jgi:CRISPR-associated protein Cas2